VPDDSFPAPNIGFRQKGALLAWRERPFHFILVLGNISPQF
jgi:hypothetical protein